MKKTEQVEFYDFMISLVNEIAETAKKNPDDRHKDLDAIREKLKILENNEIYKQDYLVSYFANQILRVINRLHEDDSRLSSDGEGYNLENDFEMSSLSYAISAQRNVITGEK